jgi:hypothetical protein
MIGIVAVLKVIVTLFVLMQVEDHFLVERRDRSSKRVKQLVVANSMGGLCTRIAGVPA